MECDASATGGAGTSFSHAQPTQAATTHTTQNYAHLLSQAEYCLLLEAKAPTHPRSKPWPTALVGRGGAKFSALMAKWASLERDGDDLYESSGAFPIRSGKLRPGPAARVADPSPARRLVHQGSVTAALHSAIIDCHLPAGRTNIDDAVKRVAAYFVLGKGPGMLRADDIKTAVKAALGDKRKHPLPHCDESAHTDAHTMPQSCVNSFLAVLAMDKAIQFTIRRVEVTTVERAPVLKIEYRCMRGIGKESRRQADGSTVPFEPGSSDSSVRFLGAVPKTRRRADGSIGPMAQQARRVYVHCSYRVLLFVPLCRDAPATVIVPSAAHFGHTPPPFREHSLHTAHTAEWGWLAFYPPLQADIDHATLPDGVSSDNDCTAQLKAKSDAHFEAYEAILAGYRSALVGAVTTTSRSTTGPRVRVRPQDFVKTHGSGASSHVEGSDAACGWLWGPSCAQPLAAEGSGVVTGSAAAGFALLLVVVVTPREMPVMTKTVPPRARARRREIQRARVMMRVLHTRLELRAC